MYISKLIKTLNQIKSKDIENFYKILQNKIKKKKNIFVFGNGGSATTAQHFITDWNKMYLVHKRKRIKGICLNENIGLLNERLGWHITVQGILEDQIRAAEESQKAEDVAEHKWLQKDFSDSNTGIESRFDPIERLSNEPSS